MTVPLAVKINLEHELREIGEILAPAEKMPESFFDLLPCTSGASGSSK